uniref:Uncharacterized protein n=1 Tax=Myoviridae sp. ctNQV2 TaxID=2827683 RepID=A0A8S5S0A7_9CAUD|nr:MAG TPA: hypothetical protein [Myoviridae sp. ctNQV2]
MNSFIIRYEPCMIYISVSFPRNFYLFYFANIRLIFISAKFLILKFVINYHLFQEILFLYISSFH